MHRVTRPHLARRCPVPWTAREDEAFIERLRVLREDIRAVGGLETWLETRLDVWLASVGPCRRLPHAARTERRRRTIR